MTNKYYENIKEFINSNLSFLIFLILLLIAFRIDTGYSIYKPGGSINITNRIHSETREAGEGTYNMAYVGMIKGKLPFYLIAKILPSWDLVKNTDLTYNETESIDDLLKRDKLYYEESMSAAKYLAYEKSNTPHEIVKVHNYIAYVDEKCDGDIKIGDELISYDGTKYIDIPTLKEYIGTKEVGDKISLVIKRGNKETKTPVTIFAIDDVLLIGLMSTTIYEIESETKITIDSKAGEGGPSGGLMLSLAMYDLLVDEDLTKGNKIVGTGTISLDGTVGEIGGVTYKLAGAVKDKADIFIVPNDNYKEASEYAKKHKYDIIIKGVSSFEDTLEVLKQMEEKNE